MVCFQKLLGPFHLIAFHIKPTTQHILELLQEARTSFDFLKNESNPLTFLSKWSCIQRVLTKFKELQCTTTESQQSHEQMTPHLPDVSKTFGNPVREYVGWLV
jgi:hypothetical protein